MKPISIILILAFVFASCTNSPKKTDSAKKIKILIDSDANNELDDQHALAYAFLNSDVFDVAGITVNNTNNGGGIQGQYDEAQRIISLFNLQDRMPLLKGATATYSEILPFIGQAGFDGQEAVDFIIGQAQKAGTGKLVLIPVGKLTNIALAFAKAPEIVSKVKVVWLGSNFPEPGEYNLDNDTSAVNPVIESGVDFEMVVVRYGLPSGTAAVTVTPEMIKTKVAGKGPVAGKPVTGRHGGEFTTFGDYSMNLFEKAEMHGNPPSRALFDMAAVAVVKNAGWAARTEIPAPKLVGNSWLLQPENPKKIFIRENFNREAILMDFFTVLNESTPGN